MTKRPTKCWKCGTPLHRVSVEDSEGWTNAVVQCETQGCVSLGFRRKLISRTEDVRVFRTEGES